MSVDRWKLGKRGYKFHDGKGTVRELVRVWQRPNKPKTARYRRVDWMKVEGKGPENGSMAWASWVRWVEDEWLPPRPDQLPVPEVSQADIAFPTDRHNPPWHWVKPEFKAGNDPLSDHENSTNPWCRLVDTFVFGRRDASEWQAIPKEGIDPQKAFDVASVAMRSWGSRVEVKIATVAYMLSEWFVDFWWKGDTYTVVNNYKLSELIEGWEG